MIRSARQSDIIKIENLLRKIHSFNAEEFKVAMELINIAVNDSNQSDYNVFVYQDGEEILGYHCTGRRPLTDAVYDLYWIVVDPEKSGTGVGRKLLEHAENFVKEKKGRWIIAETSSKAEYISTQNFYFRNNYTILGEIKDFYSVGDNLLIFGKFFNHKQN
jgi:aminoglycoside 6'-N-acetyltransferase I